MGIRWFAVIFTAGLCLCQQGPDPWPSAALLDPAALANILKSPGARQPHVISVVFPVLYRARHIEHAVFAGPGSKPEGVEALKKAVAGLDKDADIVLYCGCCPMDRCPNIRPAFRVLAELGYKHVRVLNIPDNLKTDWTDKGYPVESSLGTPK
ncbi:MAG TPA: rhodanese-like domain-containing protein [Bryobacteraceae bacterium]|jgi:rhodanese-related sulfurtransferase